MDFATLMKSHIASATPSSTKDHKNNSNNANTANNQPPDPNTDANADRTASSTSTPDPATTQKYLKRSDLEAHRQAAYAREQAALESARRARLEQKRQRDDEAAERDAAREAKRARLAETSRRVRAAEQREEENKRRVRIGLPALPSPEVEGEGEGEVKEGEGEEEEEEEEEELAEEVLLARLRERGEPRYLFGETPRARRQRYRRLVARQTLAPHSQKQKNHLSDGPIPTSLALLPEQDMKIPAHVPAAADEKALLRRQLASYFDLVLREWAGALARRAPEVKTSLSGRKAQQSYEAARENLRPLFRKLESEDPGALGEGLLAAVVEITHLAQLRRYVAANDAYLRLSIGQAAWPIGVTMVGIHERSAREKLHETDREGKGAARIMSDEVTRKMLQGIKRGLTFAQTRWPPEDVGQLMG